MHFYTTEDFPEKLLEVIDADQLPVYYGGTKCDPDGNPKCESLVRIPRVAPELYTNTDIKQHGTGSKKPVL